MKDKLRILAASDLHGDMDIAAKLSKKAKDNNVDLIILAGDLNGVKSRGGRVLEPFEKAHQKVVFVPGNWDTEEEHFIMAQKMLSIDEAYVNYNGVGIAGIGADWSFSLDKEDLNKIGDSFEAIDKFENRKRILVSHMHAADTRTEDFGWPGDKILRSAVLKFKPDILIAAHIHEAEGLEDLIGKTKVFQVGKTGKIIEI